MATRYWTPAQSNRKQVSTFTVTAYDASTVYKITIGRAVVSVTGTTDAAGTASALQALLAASEYPQFQEMSWTYPGSGAVVTATASTAGTPFTFTASVTGGTGTISQATSTTNTSENDVNDAANWGGTLPGTGDSIVIENSDVDLLWNLDAFSAADITALTVRSTFTGKISLPTQNSNGYYEYRPTELQMQTCTTLYEEQSGNLDAASRKYAVGANACTATFIGSGGGSVGSEITWFRGTNASNAVRTSGASVALAALASGSTTVATLNMVNGSVVSGSSGLAALTTVTNTDSTLDLQSNITTYTQDGSSSASTFRQTMTIGTNNLRAGTCTDLSSGTWTTLALGTQTNGATVDFSQDKRAKTITNLINVYKGSTYNDPDNRTTMSAGFTIPNGSLGDVTMNLGIGKTYTPS